ncbi:unnamed protein product [Prorocentrum cordatum]|uniref:Uncharacterized protein n=1 Tax=Prorocentrum cordatum TaxID=2364126 RepID=A0ABN9V9A3_9DINO|nr:unnamed protein product [Polarella glacialis]
MALNLAGDAQRTAPPPRGGGCARAWRGLAQVAPRRLGPNHEIDGWTLKFVSPKMETGFLRSHQHELRSSLILLIVLICCGLPVMLNLWYGGDASESFAPEVQTMKRRQCALSMACVGLTLLALVAAVLLSDLGMICTRGMESLAFVDPRLSL